MILVTKKVSSKRKLTGAQRALLEHDQALIRAETPYSLTIHIDDVKRVELTTLDILSIGDYITGLATTVETPENLGELRLPSSEQSAFIDFSVTTEGLVFAIKLSDYTDVIFNLTASGKTAEVLYSIITDIRHRLSGDSALTLKMAANRV